MPEQVSIQVGGNVDGNIVVGDNNFVVNTNHGTIVYKQAGPQVKPRGFVPQPPRAPRGFINRTVELAKLEAWIAANEIVLLHGPDGMGKSALLKQAANSEAARALPNGVVLLESADADGQALGPDDVIQSLFDALFESDPPLKVDAVSAHTYLSNTRPLILMDEVGLSPTLQAKLPDLFPKGAILLSADLPLGGDFQRLQVGPLPRVEAVNLLATRAELALSDENRPVLEEICALLGDVSLAVIITGNVLREMHIAPAAALQAIQALPIPDANANLMAIDRAFAFAFGQLSPEEQKVLSAAALTPGLSMTPEWLSVALGGVGVDAFIERLKSLDLLFANSPRLRLPPAFRAAARRAAVLDENDLMQRLLEFLSAPLRENPQNWEHVQTELGNFFGALAWAVGAGRPADVIALARWLDPYLTLHGLWDAWNTALGYVREAARESGERAVEAWALHQRGVRAMGAGTREQALDYLQRALRIRQSLGDAVGMAYTQHNIDLLVGAPPPPNDNRPKPRSKPTGGGGIHPLLILGVLAGLLGVLGVIALAVAVVFFPPLTAIPETPTDTATPEIFSSTDTPTPESSDTPAPTFTFTPTPTMTPLGGSGGLVFETQSGSFRRNLYTLYILPSGGSGPHPVFDKSVEAQNPAWSPDGRQIAFASGSSLNSSVAILNSSSDIYVVDSDGSNLRQLTNTGSASHPAWSPDGQQLAYVDRDAEGGFDIYVMDMDSGNLTDLTNSVGQNEDYPEWSPDGSQIAYQAFLNNENWELFVMNADGSDPKQLTSIENGWNTQPSWSPDGQQLAFVSNRTESWNIYVMDLDSFKIRALTHDKAFDYYPDWSPDGTMLAFVSNRDGDSFRLYTITIDGLDITPLAKIFADVNSAEPDWQPFSGQ